MRRPTRVLHDRRTAGGEVALGAIAEPPGSIGHVRVLRDSELGLRGMDEVAISRRGS